MGFIVGVLLLYCCGLSCLNSNALVTNLLIGILNLILIFIFIFNFIFLLRQLVCRLLCVSMFRSLSFFSTACFFVLSFISFNLRALFCEAALAVERLSGFVCEHSVLINIGAQHPSTHGVLRLLAVLNGELIQFLSVEIGLLHRGTEKLIESNNYINSIGYFDRLDYVSTISQEILFINCLERILNCYEIIYSSSLRTLFLEFYRILNHLLALTTSIIDLGLFTTMLLMFEEREKLLNFTESLSGTRFHAMWTLLGRIRYDISLKWINSLIDFIFNFIRKLKELYNITSENSLFKSRLYEIGIISKSFSLFFGISGIIARASGIMLDARIIGYEYYNAIDFVLFFANISDCWSRYYMRLMESLQASDLIFSILSLIINSFLINNHISPSSTQLECKHCYNVSACTLIDNVSTFVNNDVSACTLIAASSASSQSMEQVISHFIYPSFMLDNFPSTSLTSLDTFSNLSSPSATFVNGGSLSNVLYGLYSSCKTSIESSKGIYSIFINSMLPFSSSRAFTVNIICNDFLAITQLNKICKSMNLADFISLLGSIDFVLGSVDL